MDWIKVTPETMPPDKKPVMVTVRSKTNPSFTDFMKDVAWYSDNGGAWGWDEGEDCTVFLDDDMEVTHWMPYPEPANS